MHNRIERKLWKKKENSSDDGSHNELSKTPKIIQNLIHQGRNFFNLASLSNDNPLRNAVKTWLLEYRRITQ